MHKTSSEQSTKGRLSSRESTSRLLTLGMLFVGAFCLRLYGLGQPPMEFNAIRQYHGALLARGLYQWLLSGNLRTLPPDGILEPPILEFAASLSYLVLGGEHLWVPRLLSVLFWMIGGVFLYLVAKRIVSPNAAVFSVFFYLFDPATVTPSRAFMPESLMIMFLVISVFAIVRYHEQPQSRRRLIVAAIASSLAIFVKPGICLFQVFGAFAALSVYRQGIRRTLLSWHMVVFVVLAVLPTALYYVYGTSVAGFLQGQVQTKVVPSYMSNSYYWTGWLRSIESVVGYVALGSALVGVLLSRSRPARALLAGLWGGYFVFGLAFAHHIYTHTYYSLQLIPVVALSLGALWDSVAAYLGRVDTGRLRRAVVLGLCLLAVGVGVSEHRQTIIGIIRAENYPMGSLGEPLKTDYEGLVKDFREIGEVVDHSHHTVFFAPEVGYSLMYHGRIEGDYWPGPGLARNWEENDGKVPLGMWVILPMNHWPQNPKISFDRKDYFDALYSNASPKYFIVIRRYVEQGDKKNWKEDEILVEITRDFRVVAKDEDYVVFDLRRKRGSL